MSPGSVVLTGDVPNPIASVLVANRGEIAVRILRAARDLGIRGIVVHTSADAGALHVRLAEAAVEIGGYLDIDSIVAAAVATGARSVHPGYGFLAENAEFAAAVQAAGLIWIGPPPHVIETLGDKVSARRIAREVGAPLVAGTHAPVADHGEVEAFAQRHGLPLLIKAAFGGGGRGMKVVRELGEIAEAYEAAVRESAAAFGRGECYVERFVEAARHVEAQVLADLHGSVVVVGTRDCSVQRRNQKLIEEAPAPFLDAEVREAIHSSARALCKAAGYLGAGTVEYLLGTDGTLSFLEVNTRLQVEHPVSEESTGVDLVAEQFRLAGGARLIVGDPPARGHAIELRLVAEDAGRGFLPTPGKLTSVAWPTGPGIRVDTGVAAGDEIDGRYDSMFAKLIVAGPDRATALRRARQALTELQIGGVPTPANLYRLVLEHPDFAGPDSFAVHNRWLEGRFDVPGWVEIDGDGDSVGVRIGRRLMAVQLPGLDSLGPRAAAIRAESAALQAQIAGAVADGPEVRVPMQGTIVAVSVKDGDRVEAGDLIAVLEAMKMENPIRAHRTGEVSGLAVTVGDSVAQRAMVCHVLDTDPPA